MNAFILDDNIQNIDVLNYYINEFSTDIEVVGKATSIKESLELLPTLKVDILFVDIDLGNGQTGFMFLDQIDTSLLQVVFVTAYNEYALKAFKYHAVDYLLKPLNELDFKSCLESLRANKSKTNSINFQEVYEKLNNHSNDDIVAVPYMNKIEIIQKSKIAFIRANRKYSEIMLDSGKSYWSSRNIGEYETLFSNESFFRVHNSYLINFKYLVSIEKSTGWKCLMKDGTEIPVSRRKQEELYSRLNLRVRQVEKIG